MMNRTINLRDHLELFLSRRKLFAMLLDLNEGDLAKVNSMMHAYDENIIGIMRDNYPLEPIDRMRFATNLANKYAIRDDMAKWVVDAWVAMLDYASLCQIGGMEAQMPTQPATGNVTDAPVSPVIIVKPTVSIKNAPFPFCGKRYDSKDTLFVAMAQHWEDAKREVFRKKFITDYFRPFDLEIASLCMDAQISVEDGEDPDIALFKLIYQAIPDFKEIYWMGSHITSIVEFGNQLLHALNSNDYSFISEWNTFISNGLLSFYLRNSQIMDEARIHRLELLHYDSNSKNDALYTIGYALASDRNIKINNHTFIDVDEFLSYINKTVLSCSIEELELISDLVSSEHALSSNIEHWVKANSCDDSIIDVVTGKIVDIDKALKFIDNARNNIDYTIRQYQTLGSEVKFGTYKFKADGTTSPITWKVLKYCDGHSLMVSSEGIDCRVYHKCRSGTEISWKDSDLCHWLNSTFYQVAFSGLEQKCMTQKSTENGDLGKVFCLSYDEAEEYLGSDQLSLVLHPTEYAIQQGCRPNDFEYRAGRWDTENITNAVGWWLRNDSLSSKIDCIHTYGNYIESAPYFPPRAVRPAIYINTQSAEFRQIITSQLLNECNTIDDLNIRSFACSMIRANLEIEKYISVGSRVSLGKYSSDTSTGFENLTWVILKTENDKSLLITEKAIDCHVFNRFAGQGGWENSAIRQWLKNSFYNNSFDENERLCIESTTTVSKSYPINGGNTVTDNVFLLELADLNLFDFEPALLTCRLLGDADNQRCSWWLRTTGNRNNRFVVVDSDGMVQKEGIASSTKGIGVRPAIWVETNILKRIIASSIMSTPTHDQSKNNTQKTENEYDLAVNSGSDVLVKLRTPGNSVTFGRYPTGKDDEVAPIEWIVLNSIGERSLLISKYGIDCQRYHSKGKKSITWRESDLRNWLNSDFVNAAFSHTERGVIVESTVRVNTDEQVEDVDNAFVKDLVYCLSINEANRFLGESNSDKQAFPTEYATSNGCAVSNENCCSWWLRPVDEVNRGCCVFMHGNILTDVQFKNPPRAVRPVLSVDLTSVDLEKVFAENTTEQDLSLLVEKYRTTGASVKFGGFSINVNGNSVRWPLAWTVVASDNEQSTLVSSAAFCAVPFDDGTTLNGPSINNWLQKEFVIKCFSAFEQKAIQCSTDVYNMDIDEPRRDVRLLNDADLTDYSEYLGSAKYLYPEGVADLTGQGYQSVQWWLANSEDDCHPYCVTPEGIATTDYDIHNPNIYVRPVIVIRNQSQLLTALSMSYNDTQSDMIIDDNEDHDDGFLFVSAVDDTLELIGYNGQDKRIIIPQTYHDKRIIKIGALAFDNCTSLEEVTIPGSIQSIGKYAFAGCPHLSMVHIEKGVERIEDFAFSQDGKLTAIWLPNSICEVGNNPFFSCESLYSINIENGNATLSIYGGMLLANNMTRIVSVPQAKAQTNYDLPFGITIIGTCAFANCIGMQSISIPSSVKIIEDFAFQNCSGLTGLKLPSDMDSIGAEVFFNCSSLKSVTLPQSIAMLGNGIFHSCIALEYIDIPDSYACIPSEMFKCCDILANVHLGQSVEYIDDEAFSSCKVFMDVIAYSNIKNVSSTAFLRCKGTVKLLPIGTVSGELSISIEEFTGNISDLNVSDMINDDESKEAIDKPLPLSAVSDTISYRTVDNHKSDDGIFFMPLGGGQRVGASCYFLRLGKKNIILDAGIGIEKGTLFEPDFRPLLTSPFVKSLNQIDQIFVSHAHMDHIGYLPKLMSLASHAQVYMTEPTAMLAQHQLLDNKYADSEESTEEERLATQYLLQQVVKVGYLQTIDFGEYTATFYQAGHIPGAMMILFEYEGKRILYTGDYSVDSTDLTGGCDLLENQQIDTMIMCGLHAKHPDYRRSSDDIYSLADKIMNMVQSGKTIVCHLSQLSKGVEFLKILNSRNTCHIPIYVDEQVMRIVNVMERLAIPILNVDNHLLESEWCNDSHIVITNRRFAQPKDGRYHMQVDFTLHEDFVEMARLLKHYNPRQAILVHCALPHDEMDLTIEQALMRDGDSRTQFIFAEEKECYKIK